MLRGQVTLQWLNTKKKYPLYICNGTWLVGWSKNPLSSQTEKLMAATIFSNYLVLKHYKKSKNKKTFHPFKLSGNLRQKR